MTIREKYESRDSGTATVLTDESAPDWMVKEWAALGWLILIDERMIRLLGGGC